MLQTLRTSWCVPGFLFFIFFYSSLHLNDSDKCCYLILGPEFLHQIKILTGYCVAFCRCRYTYLEPFPWRCPLSRLFLLTYRTSCLRSLHRRVWYYTQLVFACTSYHMQTSISFSCFNLLLLLFSVFPVAACISLCVFISHSLEVFLFLSPSL